MHFNFKRKIQAHDQSGQSGDQVSAAQQHCDHVIIKMDQIIKGPHILSNGISGELIGETVQLYSRILEGTASHLCPHAA